jgi:hypothetical protein
MRLEAAHFLRRQRKTGYSNDGRLQATRARAPVTQPNLM